MRVFASLALACAVMVAAGCTTIDRIDAGIQKNIASICAGAVSLQSIYVAALPAIPADKAARVDTAFAEVEAACANPSGVTTAYLTGAVARHIAAVGAARAAAKG